ncbi:MAG: hypothetical protein QM756_33975 [Polyangiaceae bacterium]
MLALNPTSTADHDSTLTLKREKELSPSETRQGLALKDFSSVSLAPSLFKQSLMFAINLSYGIRASGLDTFESAARQWLRRFFKGTSAG